MATHGPVAEAALTIRPAASRQHRLQEGPSHLEGGLGRHRDLVVRLADIEERLIKRRQGLRDHAGVVDEDLDVARLGGGAPCPPRSQVAAWVPAPSRARPRSRARRVAALRQSRYRLSCQRRSKAVASLCIGSVDKPFRERRRPFCSSVVPSVRALLLLLLYFSFGIEIGQRVHPCRRADFLVEFAGEVAF